MTLLNLTEIEIAQELIGGSVLKVLPVNGGGNNRVYKVETVSETLLLKFYPVQAEDKRDRIGHEYDALEFMNNNGIKQIPKPLVINREHNCALYEWINGRRIDNATNEHVESLATFLLDLQNLREADGASELRNGAQDCLSIKKTCENLSLRISRLMEVVDDAPEMKLFLFGKLVPFADLKINEILEVCEREGLSYNNELTGLKRAINPSDFGFHNALLTPMNEIVFLDFEYFGWDDPVKMISDGMWHPGMQLSQNHMELLKKKLLGIFEQNDPFFQLRFSLLYPLFGLIWCTILLNEFLPERWARRTAAGHLDREERRKIQLDKAHNQYKRLKL